MDMKAVQKCAESDAAANAPSAAVVFASASPFDAASLVEDLSVPLLEFAELLSATPAMMTGHPEEKSTRLIPSCDCVSA